MRLKTILSFIILAFTAHSVWAQLPTQIGDSFLILTDQTRLASNTQLIHLANDGTCELLQCIFIGPGVATPPIPSQRGTYTYLQTPGGPTPATLTLNFPGTGFSSLSATYDHQDSFGYITATITIIGAPAYGIDNFFTLFPSLPNTFLTNVSNRVILRTSDVAVTGFVIEGTGSRFVLIRAVGPGLTQFAVSPISKNPSMTIYSSSSAPVSGQPWGSVSGYDAQAIQWISNIAGAFPLPAASNDQVYFALLAPGSYTVQATDSTVGASGGNALVEVYILPYSS